MNIWRSRNTRRHVGNVEFCDQCGSVCDSVCRAERRLDEAKFQALRWRL